MGKGKRTKINFEQEKELLKQRESIEKAKKRKSAIKTTIICALIVLLGLGSVFGSFGYVKLSENGFFARRNKVASSGEFDVSVSMMQYLFNTVVDTYETDYADYLDQIGLNTNADLKEQACSYSEDGGTWYDYFLDTTKTQVEELLILCEKAKKDGMELNENDKKYIDKNMTMFENAAEDNGQTLEEYLSDTYGSIVSIEDVRKCYELTVLATKYQNKYADTLSYTTEEIESYYNDNKAEFLSCSYLSQLISIPEDTEEEMVELYDNEAKLKAEEIAKSKTSDEFKEAVKEYLADTIVLENYSKEEKKTYVEEQLSYLEQQADYDVTTDSGEWLFSEDRKVGDTGVFKDEETGGYYVYYITAPAKKDTSDTKNARHILFSLDDYEDDEAKEKAETMLKEWLNGDRTEESFASLATLNTGDTGSIYTGGLYTDIRSGEMVDGFNSWVFDKKRKSGDTDVIETDYGWHVMYFVGDGHTAWQGDVVKKLRDNDYAEMLKKAKEDYDIKFKKNAIDDVEFIFIEETDDTTSEFSDYTEY